MAKDVVYIAVTKDKYELPIAVANTVKDLSRMTNVSERVIYTYISKKLGRFYKVKLND